MDIKLKIKPKVAYLTSIFTALIIFLFFSYKAVIAFLIYRELYGGGLDTLVLLRASVAGIMFLLIILFIQFMKINDLKSQALPIYNVEYKQKKPYLKISSKSNNYILKSFKIAVDLVKKKRLLEL